jgi:hypothetical protein
MPQDLRINIVALAGRAGGGETLKQLAGLQQLAGLPGGKPLGVATVRPFVPFTQEKFEWLRKRGRILKSMGYYKLMGGRPPE